MSTEIVRSAIVEGEYELSVADLIRDAWRKRVNPMYPDEGPHYPGRVTRFVSVSIDAQDMVFRVVIERIDPESGKPILSGY